eukprot:4168988-Pleurochrysis_carterae.AAC.1
MRPPDWRVPGPPRRARAPPRSALPIYARTARPPVPPTAPSPRAHTRLSSACATARPGRTARK